MSSVNVIPDEGGRRHRSGQMIAPDGQILGCCDARKAEWYLERGLATVVSEEPFKIRLSFDPAGRKRADDPSFVTPRELKCVACGCLSGLTKHHVVPYCYRRRMPEGVKSHSSYDVVYICRDCHNAYESAVPPLKEELGRRYGVYEAARAEWAAQQPLRDAKKCAFPLKRGCGIPPGRQGALEAAVRRYLGLDAAEEISGAALDSIAGAKTRCVDDIMSEMVGAKLDTEAKCYEFAILWRTHFIETLRPRHMPEHWKIDKPL